MSDTNKYINKDYNHALGVIGFSFVLSGMLISIVCMYILSIGLSLSFMDAIGLLYILARDSLKFLILNCKWSLVAFLSIILFYRPVHRLFNRLSYAEQINTEIKKLIKINITCPPIRQINI